MGRKRNPIPKLSSYAGRARVWWADRWHYLGEANTPESERAYRRFCADVVLNPSAHGLCQGDENLGGIVGRYMQSISPNDDKMRSRVERVLELLTTHGVATTSLIDYGPLAARSWQLWLASDQDGGPNLNRTTVKHYHRVVLAAIRWAIANELVRADQTRIDDLRELRSLSHTEGRPPRKVLPVADEIVERTIPLLLSPVAAMVQLQRLVGLRPQEVTTIRPCEIHTTGVVRLSSGLTVDLKKFGAVWVYVPHHHKLSSRDKPRDAAIGPKAQAVLGPFLQRDPQAYCFSPREAVAELRAKQVAERLARGGGSGGNRKRKRNPEEYVRHNAYYTACSYRQAIQQACERAGIPKWFPYQLRHSAGSEAVAVGGIDAARAMLGHEDPRTTTIYAERDFELAAKLAQKMG